LHLQNDCEELPIALSPLAPWNNLAPTKHYCEILWSGFFLQSVYLIQVWLKLDKSNRHFVWRPLFIGDLSARLFFVIETDCSLSEVNTVAEETAL